MKITTKIDIYCQSGFYCMKNGNNKCGRLLSENGRYYCDVFYTFCETDINGNVLKCEECLLAERKERVKT